MGWTPGLYAPPLRPIRPSTLPQFVSAKSCIRTSAPPPHHHHRRVHAQTHTPLPYSLWTFFYSLLLGPSPRSQFHYSGRRQCKWVRLYRGPPLSGLAESQLRPCHRDTIARRLQGKWGVNRPPAPRWRCAALLSLLGRPDVIKRPNVYEKYLWTIEEFHPNCATCSKSGPKEQLIRTKCRDLNRKSDTNIFISSFLLANMEGEQNEVSGSVTQRHGQFLCI